ncbi:CBS domain-containing protein [Salsuginibacillus kocurii]|uniref:CBS domain-containing protein n=1 Tax=Salsuginibacillus kocurii TaxID=427078 RepID=UPI0003787148|nr:CBS domain-containing protein [Salsuginibacillus kocurii]
MSVVKEYMTPKVREASSSDDLATLAKHMRDEDVGFVPVAEDDKYVGVVTDRDIVVKGLAKGSSDQVKASDIMTRKVITGTTNMEVEEAARLMQEHQIKRLLVVENSTVEGVVTLGDLGYEGATEVAANVVREVSKGAANN